MRPKLIADDEDESSVSSIEENPNSQEQNVTEPPEKKSNVIESDESSNDTPKEQNDDRKSHDGKSSSESDDDDDKPIPEDEKESRSATEERSRVLDSSSDSEDDETTTNDKEPEKESQSDARARILESSSDDDSDDEGNDKAKEDKEPQSDKEGRSKVIETSSDDDSDDEKVKAVDDEEKDYGKKDQLKSNKSSSDSDDDDEDEETKEVDEEEPESEGEGRSKVLVYDFDIMMAKKKEEDSRRRRRRNYEIINDNDDFIADMINQMKTAVDEDMEANKQGKAATSKLKQLNFVMSQLRKVDLREAFLDSDVLSVITDWLTPLPDKSLPHLKIREDLLKILLDFNICDVEKIKASAIGKAVMYLYKHPKETKENKVISKKLISSWSRPIFQLDTSFSAISREEREERDMELRDRHKQNAQKAVQSNPDIETNSQASKKKDDKSTKALKPGDIGWIPRARVPAPSMRDYVIRPRSKVEGDVGKSSRRPTNMLDKYLKAQQERKRAGKTSRAVNMKIDRI